MEVEHWVDLVLGLGEFAAVDGVQDGTSVLQRATLASGRGASANPAGVEQPRVDLVLSDLLSQHLRIAHRVQSQEGLGETRRECRLRFRHTILSAGHLGGVTGNEVEHGLLRGELGDRRQHTTGVAGQEDDVGGMLVGDARNLGIGNVFNGVGAVIEISNLSSCTSVHESKNLPASVLSKGGVVVVDDTGRGVEDHVLQDGAKLDGVENVGFLLSRQTNALGVALLS